MTVREVINALIECKCLDEEFTVEVHTGTKWVELTVEAITNCDDVGGGCCATTYPSAELMKESDKE